MKNLTGSAAFLAFLLAVGAAGSVEHGAGLWRLLLMVPALAMCLYFVSKYRKMA